MMPVVRGNRQRRGTWQTGTHGGAFEHGRFTNRRRKFANCQLVCANGQISTVREFGVREVSAAV